MKVGQYYAILITLLLTFFGVVCLEYRLEPSPNNGIDEPSKFQKYHEASRVLGNFLTGCIIAVLIFILKFLHQLIYSKKSLSSSIDTTTTPHHLHSTYHLSFYHAILEEVLKFSIIWYQASKCAYHPYKYHDKYAKFLRYYNIWINQDLYRSRHLVENEGEVEELWENIIEEENSDNENENDVSQEVRHSLSSNESNETIVDRLLNKKVSYKVLPSEFKSRLEETRSFETLPIEINGRSRRSSGFSHTSRLNARDYKSCSDLITRLYSVSPGNTYYLNTAVAIAAFDDSEQSAPVVKQDFTNNQDPTRENLFLSEIEESYENIDEEHIERDEGPIERDEEHIERKRHDTIKALIKGINWFSWLLPPLLPIRKAFDANPITTNTTTTTTIASNILPSQSIVNERFPLLKASLSRYSLKQPTTTTTITTKLPDLESNPNSSNPLYIFKTTIDRSGSFQFFLSYYFDTSLDPITLNFIIDHWFLKYGQLIVDTFWVWFLIDELNYMIFQFINFQTLGTVVRGYCSIWKNVTLVLTIILIPKLFRLNFLHNPENKFDYRVAILGEM
ncbi:hypothetical protein KGF56_001749, partial [Candida oxycetoniae]